MYAKICSQVHIRLVFSTHGTADQLTLDRLAAAKQAGKPSGVDLWESGLLLEAGQSGLLRKLSPAAISNLKRVNPEVFASYGGYGVPYRGSSVVLAYNSNHIAHPPRTLSGLERWIQAHPGKFTYNPPNTGGSGDAFVQAVLEQFLQPAESKAFFTGYAPQLEAQWKPGWHELIKLGKDMYQGGFYPQGNVGVLQALGRGSIWMAPVWSDMSLSYLAQGLLPSSIKLEQLQPPFYGGSAYIGIPKDSAHPQAAEAFLNWLLTPGPQAVVVHQMHGYPGVEWKYVPSSVQRKFAAIAENYGVGFSPKFDADMAQKWSQKVAGSH
jgi:putative spermidine/putrescine transport system substrate-binding protein